MWGGVGGWEEGDERGGERETSARLSTIKNILKKERKKARLAAPWEASGSLPPHTHISLALPPILPQAPTDTGPKCTPAPSRVPLGTIGAGHSSGRTPSPAPTAGSPAQRTRKEPCPKIENFRTTTARARYTQRRVPPSQGPLVRAQLTRQVHMGPGTCTLHTHPQVPAQQLLSSQAISLSPEPGRPREAP